MVRLQPAHIRFRIGWGYAKRNGLSRWKAFVYGCQLATVGFRARFF